MYNRTNRAALIAQIGAVNRPQITDGKSIDFSGAVDTFLNARDVAEKRAKEQEQQGRLDVWREKLMGNDTLDDNEKALYSAYPELYAQKLRGDTQFEQQKELASINNAAALDRAKQIAQLRKGGGYTGNIEGFTPTGNPDYDKATLTQLAKDNAEKRKAMDQVAQMTEPLKGALSRADTSLANGEGIGATSARGALGEGFFGQLFSSENADKNRANIKTANSQMNSFLRAKLSSLGLTGSELNSALEAEAYRYTINPNDSAAEIKQKIDNFRNDYLGKGSAAVLSRLGLSAQSGMPSDNDAWGDI